jgi:hypothetical protein
VRKRGRNAAMRKEPASRDIVMSRAEEKRVRRWRRKSKSRNELAEIAKRTRVQTGDAKSALKERKCEQEINRNSNPLSNFEFQS